MREMSLEEIKECELNILKYLDQFCKKHNLRYFLAGGTLIGAIRHKGFIPWDDDIDIIMPRPDYTKLLRILNSKNSIYRVHSCFDGEWRSTFAIIEDTRTKKEYLGFNQNKSVGVDIDIFPTDGTPNNYYLRRCFFFLLNRLSNIVTLSDQKFKISKHYVDKDTRFTYVKTMLRTFVKFLAIPIARITRVFNLSLLINKIAMHYDVYNSKFIGVSVMPHYGYKECIHAEGFLEIENRLFEGDYYSTPLHYDEYLSNLYGDYMKMPPIDKQVSHHDFIAYWKD